MNKDVRKKLLLGVLVATGSILFIVGIFFIGRKQSLYTATFQVNTFFNDINGLREGDFVRYAGAQVGIVEKIKFVNDSMIQVQMKIEKKMQPFIKKDVIAYIATEGLVGNKLINLHPKHKSRKTIEENDTVEAINPFNTEEIIEKLLSTNNNAAIITENLAKLSKQLNDKKGIIQTLINDSVSTNNLKEIILNVKTTSSQLAIMSHDFEKTVDRINIGGGLAGTLLNDTSLTRQLKQTLTNLKLTSEYSTTITKQITQSMQSGNSSGTFGMLMKDSTFAQNLRQSVINLQQGTAKLNDNMEALQHNFLLKGYFKKKNKSEK